MVCYINREPNRLYEYDYSQNGACFLTICTQDRKKILSQIAGGGAHIAPPVHNNPIVNKNSPHPFVKVYEGKLDIIIDAVGSSFNALLFLQIFDCPTKIRKILKRLDFLV